MWRRRKDRSPGRGEARRAAGGGGFDTIVAGECEAFLAGQLAGYHQDRGRPVPPVAWLNQIVHSTPNELAILALGLPDKGVPSMWSQAVGYLARTVIDRARETGRPVGELQRELLLPLELDLMGKPEAAGIDAADLTRLALARIYELPELPA